MSQTDFVLRGDCRFEDPELWFPVGEDLGATPEQLLAQTVQARAVCAGCPVRRQCLQWALDTEQAFGVWGGLTTPQRRELQRAAPVAA